MRDIKMSGSESVDPGKHPPYLRLCRREPYVFARWDADGYRLPTDAE
jgi:hypothetical protein